jgi:hypothetical protein
VLPKLANPPRPGAGYQHQGKSANGIVFTWADPDPMVLPTRHVFVGFILALLETGDKSLVRPVLAQKALLGRGLHSLTSKLNLRTFGNSSLTSELNLSTFGTHPRVNWGCMGDKVSLS